MKGIWQNFPIDSFFGAFETLLGRFLLIALMSTIGSIIGVMIGSGEFSLGGLFFPLTMLFVFFSGLGMISTFVYFAFTFLFLRLQLPLRYSIGFLIILVFQGALAGIHIADSGI